MIIDSHTHLGRNNHILASVDQLLVSMDGARIDQALVFAGDLNDAPNNWTQEQIKPHRDRLKMVACANPLKWDTYAWLEQDASKLADMYQAGEIVAVKFYTGYDHYFPNDKVMEYYLSHLEDVGCPAIFHMGDCLNSVKAAKLKYAQPLHIDDVAVDYPGMSFIIAHVGYPWVRDTAEVCYKNSNVYTDISGFVYGKFQREDQLKFEKMLNEFLSISGTDKLLFGTDWPICDQNSYRESLEWVQNCCLDSKVGQCLTAEYMSKNVQRAFNLL